MGFPTKKLIDIGVIAAGIVGVDLGSKADKEALEIEAQENKLLAQILKQEQTQTIVLLKILHDTIGDDEFDEFLKETGLE